MSSNETQPRTDPKTKSIQQNSQQWKENLRRDCLERAKAARRERLMRQRAGCPSTAFNDDLDRNSLGGGAMKRDREGRYADDFSDEAGDYYSARNHHETCSSNNIDSMHVTAKSLVEQELQRSLMGLRHCHQLLPLNGEENASKRKPGRIPGAGTSVDLNMDCLDDYSDFGEECKMSQEEYLELLNEVTEELEREDEMLEVELQEMERLEALEHERMLHDIADFESWEEEKMQHIQNNQSPHLTVYTSPFTNSSSPLVTCPICNSKSLIETPFDGIRCSNSSSNVRCNFQLDVAHEGLSLHHLQSRLAALYEEHAKECNKGVLRFRMENRGGMSMLMAGCEECHVDLVVL